VKIVIGRDALFEGLQSVNSVVPQKPTLPVLSNFLLRAENGRLSVSGTDMDMYITTLIKCTVFEEGSITVNAKRFLGVIRELPVEDITITVSNERLTVSFCQGEASIMGMSSSDFPSVRETMEGMTIGVTGADFMEMVDKTSFSVATDRTRLALTGVYWKIAQDRMSMVATDGHRLSLFEKAMNVDFKTGETQEAEAIVPPKALSQAARVFSGGVELEKVVFGKGSILFDFGTTTIFSKLIEGPYPNFRQVIPTSNSRKVTVSTDQFSSAVRRVSVLSNTITHQIRMALTPGQMEITTINQDIGGEARESLNVNYDGETLVVGYNASFLLEIFRAIDTEEVVLELETPMAACIIRPSVPLETQEYLYLIMPLRLNE
jgi:DNA polymerase-3 subunit beta